MQGAGTGGGGRRGAPFDESSWQWKYRNGERPELDYDKVVTLETKLPTLPSQSEVKKKPSKDDF